MNERQETIAKRLDPQANAELWGNWKWQLRNCIRSVEIFEEVLGITFSDAERAVLQTTVQRFPLSITPYYASLIDPEHYREDPVFKQAFPMPQELHVQQYDMADPLTEDDDSPVPGITHRYPDRVLFHVSNVCSMYCRHCTRKRKVGDVESVPTKQTLQEGIQYIRATPAVRDVLLSGGDPFLLSNAQLEWLLQEITAIPHVEIVRIGTRTPVVLPSRITQELVTMLKQFQPLWVNVHFNHPKELTAESAAAVAKLADAGFPLGNQSVLLAGVNDSVAIMKRLVHQLVKHRIRPYYMYQCDLSEGLAHFRTPVGKGIEIMENLIGHTSGLCVPTYVIDAPGGGGKIPILPNYILSWSTNKVVLRNYEGVITTYQEPERYQVTRSDQPWDEAMGDTQATHPVGVGRLLSDDDTAISLVPENNDRMGRRNGRG